MSRIVAIGSELALAGYALAGVDVLEADEPDDVRQAWDDLGADTGLVLLTHEARRALPDELDRTDLLHVVLPR